MEVIQTIIGTVCGFLYYPLLIILLLLCGLFFTIRTRFVQGRLFLESFKVVLEKPMEKHHVSSFQALMVSTASRVGTGNIIGVSTAICLGGYGAVFWMWLLALIGGATAFVESTLAQIYKHNKHDYGCIGGPAYYIKMGLKSKKLAVIFTLSLIATFAGGYNLVCSYNLQSTFQTYSFYNETTPYIIGAIIACLVGFSIFGGSHRIVKLASTLVPFMGIFYILVTLIVVVLHFNLIPGVLAAIVQDAFDFQSIFSGVAGSCMIYGIKRGLYSNEAGMGSAPNAAASAHVSHPVKQGLVQMLSVFIDTLVLCSATAFMCLCSGITPTAEIAGAPYVAMALNNTFGGFGAIFLTVSMVLFAFTTLLGNLFYVDNALVYLNYGKPLNKTATYIYKVIACLIIFLGAIMPMSTAWDLADITMGVMALINLPTCVILGKYALRALDDYIKQKKEGKDPVFKYETVGITDKLDYWN
ncbi:MAG: alanine:cation symporter family protein [Fibrobacteraceae bacterium]|nr:alanine:cation symporter family protein [Fibrobacteraceae bacterium]